MLPVACGARVRLANYISSIMSFHPNTLDVVFDMETHDPDDFLTLVLLLGHPQVRLKAVTITPGSVHQVGVVRWALEQFGVDLPVGAGNMDHPKTCVSSWHYRAFGSIPPCKDAEAAGEVLLEYCDEDTTLVTGAPLKNLGAAMQSGDFTLGRWVAQGGFAGAGVVPEAQQLPKFRGRRICGTFNLNGDPKSALQALAHPGIGQKLFVSKNVCHGVVYDEAMHTFMASHRERSRSLEMIWHGMEVFLAKKRVALLAVNEEIGTEQVRVAVGEGAAVVMTLEEALSHARAQGLDLMQSSAKGEPPFCRLGRHDPVEYGKKLHDPLAACCAIDESIGTFAEVELFRERGQWGSRLAPGSGTRIIVDYDHQRFLDVFTASP